MTRELKLALIVGFSLVLVVTVLISDHLSRARTTVLEPRVSQAPALSPTPPQEVVEEPLPVDPTPSFAMDTATPGTDAGTTSPTDTSRPLELVMSRQAGADSGLRDVVRSLGGDIAGGRITLPPAAGLTSDPQPVGGTTDLAGNGGTNQPANTPAGRGVELGPSRSVAGPNQGLPPAAPVSNPAPAVRSYTVLEGDSVYKIAKREYGNGESWRRLVELNKGVIPANGALRVGMKITLPASAGATGAVPAAKVASPDPLKTVAPRQKAEARPTDTSKGAFRTYVVKKGDTLGSIASRELGSAKRAGEILDLNRGTLKSADVVPLGASLRLPQS